MDAVYGTGLPNSVGPGKQPLQNMCATAVTRSGAPLYALGGSGGRRIPNGVYSVLCELLFADGDGAQQEKVEAALAVRLGTTTLGLAGGACVGWRIMTAKGGWPDHTCG